MFVSKKRHQRALNEIDRLQANLHALRMNAFITNEKGHRVRYINASDERRAKAEGREI